MIDLRPVIGITYPWNRKDFISSARR